MDSVSGELSIALKDAFRLTEYADLVALQDGFWNVMYSGRPGVDYCFRPFLGLCKMIGVDPETLYGKIADEMDMNINYVAYMTFENNNVNFVLKDDYIKRKLGLALIADLVKPTNNPLKILVDFSSPNVAKDMHVGHLRSTIIGDIICRYFETRGDHVMRVNHIGDFGLPFGMIIQYMMEECPDFMQMRDVLTIANLQEFYAKSKERFDKDARFNELAHQRVVELQSGDPEIVEAWNLIKDISRDAYNEVYDRLCITLDEVGESFYQNMIPGLVNELTEKGLLVEDDGRLVFRIDGSDLPLTVVKRDGGYTYDTTDLAAIRYRLVDLNVDRVYYVVGIAQAEHFDLLFKAARIAGWVKENQELHHIGFGLILGEDGKPFKSRNGDTVKLVDLLDEGITKAKEIVEARSDALTTEEIQQISSSVAYGAIKYYDLSSSRSRDYKFSYDNMLSMKGNSSPYNLYAYTRIVQILKNLPSSIHLEDILDINKFAIKHKSERELAIHIIQFPDVFDRIGHDFQIHILCDYLYKLSTTFHNFYKNCRCIEFAEDRKTVVGFDETRLMLCFMTQKVMAKCFDLLNIQTLEKM
jgi:arginyl-tRNA synthetase